MTPSVKSLLAAHKRGDKGSLRSLAVVLSRTLQEPAPMPTDPIAVEAEAEVRGWEQPNTWQEVRAARDFGDITPAEYEYLAAAVEALTQED